MQFLLYQLTYTLHLEYSLLGLLAKIKAGVPALCTHVRMCVGAAHLSDGLVISPGTFTLITSTPFGCDQSGCPNFALFCVDLSHLSDGQVTGLGIRLRKKKPRGRTWTSATLSSISHACS